MSLALDMRAAERHASRREPVAVSDSPVLSLTEIRHHVAQGLDDDDVLLQSYAEVAQRWVEGYLGRSVLRATWREWYDGPFRGRVLLLHEQASSVTSLKVYDASDAETTVAPSVYQVDLVSQPSRLVVREGQSWPVNLRAVNAIAVEYLAGWASAREVPPGVKAAIAILTAHQYTHREPLQPGNLAAVPYGIESVLRPYRLRTGAA